MQGSSRGENLIEVQFGKNCSLKKELDNVFNYGLFMIFKDENTIKKYNQLEFHKNAQDIMEEYQEKLLVFDIKY